MLVTGHLAPAELCRSRFLPGGQGASLGWSVCEMQEKDLKDPNPGVGVCLSLIWEALLLCPLPHLPFF